MKNFLILLAVVLVGAGVYWKFRDDIHGKVEDLKRAEETGGGSASLVDKAKSVIPSAPSTPKANERLPLVDAEFIRRLPDSLTEHLASGQTADVLVEVCDGEEGGALPTQIQLNSNVWLDTTSIQLPAGSKVGSLMLVHLISASPAGAGAASPQYAIQCAAEPAPAALQDSVRRNTWRGQLPEPVPIASTAQQGSLLWVTEFAAKAKRGELAGSVNVEGTFGALRRATGNQSLESVSMEEAKDIQFFFSKGTIWHSNVQEAEKWKKQGQRVTLKMLVRTNDNPKYVAQEVIWRAPLKDKYQHWRRYFVDRKMLRNALALGRWAEIRGLADEAKETYQLTQALVTREGMTSMGRPRLSARLHLADEVQDHRVFSSNSPASQVSGVPWGQMSIEEEFSSSLRPAYVILKTNSRSESAGEYVLIDH